ncbi:MAG: TetR/AcrR family transcriptional regulator [Lachnospiraceae bacterium]|nr:TetR/AcrR family transcriptional regulator [Lachnospiraceae bacterium]
MKHMELVSRPKTKRGLETLNLLLSAAAQVIYEKGYNNSSITDITNAAGVASGTFYVYFDSKENMYRFLLYQCSHIIRKHLAEATANCRTREEIERVGLREWLNFVRLNPYVYNVIWESLYVDKQLFVDYYVNFSKAYIKGIEKAKRDGEVCANIDSESLAFALMGATNFIGLNWCIFQDRSDEFDKVVETYMKVLTKGIFTEKSRRGEDNAEKPLTPNWIRVDFSDYDDDDEGEENPGN